MADRNAIEARLTRAGLDPEQVQAAFEQNAADLDRFQRWLESVHDDDIQGGTDGQGQTDGSAGGA